MNGLIPIIVELLFFIYADLKKMFTDGIWIVSLNISNYR